MKSWKHNWAYPEIREFHETVSLFGTLSNTCRPMDTDPHLAYMSTRVLPTTFKFAAGLQVWFQRTFIGVVSP